MNRLYVTDYTGRKLYEGDAVLLARNTKDAGNVGVLQEFTLIANVKKTSLVLLDKNGKRHAYYMGPDNLIGKASLNVSE